MDKALEDRLNAHNSAKKGYTLIKAKGYEELKKLGHTLLIGAQAMALRLYDSQSWREKTDQCQCLYAHKSNTQTNYILAVRSENGDALPDRHPKKPTMRNTGHAKTNEIINQNRTPKEIRETVSEKYSTPNPEKTKENQTQSLIVKERTITEINTQK